MKINTDLLLEIREKVVNTKEGVDGEFYDQTMWATKRSECGTSYCVAGWAVHLSGLEVRWGLDETGRYDQAAFTLKDGRQIPAVAADLLGLHDEDADELFAGTISKSYVLEQLDKLIEKGKAQG